MARAGATTSGRSGAGSAVGAARPDRAALELRRLDRILDAFSNLSLLVAGDVVLDEYLWGEVERVSPEAPVPVVQVRRESLLLGGAGNVVRNITALGGKCVFCTVVGDDADGRRVIELLENLGVGTDGVMVAQNRPTTRKTRVVATGQQVVRYDRESLEPSSASVARGTEAFVAAALPDLDGAILADYGKGFLSRGLIQKLMRHLREADVPVAVDPKLELLAYHGAALLKPNLREAQAFTGVSMHGHADLERIVAELRKQTAAQNIVVTRGREGVTLFEGDLPAVEVPTVPQEVFDVQGAGDTSIATLALSLRAGASRLEAAVLANAAAGVVVGKVGTATATRGEVRDHLPAIVAAAGRDA